MCVVNGQIQTKTQLIGKFLLVQMYKVKKNTGTCLCNTIKCCNTAPKFYYFSPWFAIQHTIILPQFEWSRYLNKTAMKAFQPCVQLAHSWWHHLVCTTQEPPPLHLLTRGCRPHTGHHVQHGDPCQPLHCSAPIPQFMDFCLMHSEMHLLVTFNTTL